MKNDRLANTVLYLLAGCPDAGLTKLLKLLYFADYTHYREHLTTITGATYVALERGPVLDGYEEELDSLERRGFLAIRDVPVFGHEKPKKEYMRLGAPDPDAFNESEIATLDEVLLKYGRQSGVALSKLTHEESAPWEHVWDPSAPGAVIPYALWRWLDNMASERDVKTAQARRAAAAATQVDADIH
jgi:uncharacterized phage-associated protein